MRSSRRNRVAHRRLQARAYESYPEPRKIPTLCGPPMSRTDTAFRIAAAPPYRVFSALIDPEALTAWLPPSGLSGRFEQYDARPGGTYRLVLTYADACSSPGEATADTDIVEARFVEVVPDERLVQAIDFVADDPNFVGTMTLTWETTPVEEATRVDITVADVPDGISAEDHATGLASSLANLAGHLEGQNPPPPRRTDRSA